MLIKALCDYDDVQQDKYSETSFNSDLFSKQDVSYMILLTPEGTISGIVDIRDIEEIVSKNGKVKAVMRPRSIILPKRSQKSAIDLNIIEHRPLYIFGLNYDKAKSSFTPDDKTDKAKKSHDLFVKGNLEFCEELRSPMVSAYVNFLKNWQPERETENPHLFEIAKNYTSSFYFALSGSPTITLHEDKELIEKYVRIKEKESKESVPKNTAICPIEGKNLPTARIHEKIKGIRGGAATGGVLIGMKNSAFESYGKRQSYNSAMSDVAMKKYTRSLNALLADRSHNQVLGDITLIYFAVDKNDSSACDIFSAMLYGSEDEELERSLDSVAKQIAQGKTGDLSALEVSEDAQFYVVGLAPNSARISQKFIIRNSFGRVVQNLIEHQHDLKMRENAAQTPIWRLTKELVSPKSKDTVSSPLISSVFMSIINGTNYPVALLETVIRRVRTDSDEENKPFIKMNEVRVGIIKACLNRRARFSNQKEEITMALDETNRNPSYLCGRLFAVLEKVQQDASGGNLNRTIKDAYFNSACVRPATTLPKLVILSQNHLAKLTPESKIYYSKLIGSISSLFEGEFPTVLSLENQGRFILGYYQQNKMLYTSTKNKEVKGNAAE
ncbi:MAG: type I-C CRISPR-associated protein Cas8c/Csd1 [Eubacteriales bacterium]|nr:type I-C CRISPR-associated protein Cas8c/Csd1 [Eubacteriales bacterium]